MHFRIAISERRQACLLGAEMFDAGKHDARHVTSPHCYRGPGLELAVPYSTTCLPITVRLAWCVCTWRWELELDNHSRFSVC